MFGYDANNEYPYTHGSMYKLNNHSIMSERRNIQCMNMLSAVTFHQNTTLTRANVKLTKTQTNASQLIIDESEYSVRIYLIYYIFLISELYKSLPEKSLMPMIPCFVQKTRLSVLLFVSGTCLRFCGIPFKVNIKIYMARFHGIVWTPFQSVDARIFFI